MIKFTTTKNKYALILSRVQCGIGCDSNLHRHFSWMTQNFNFPYKTNVMVVQGHPRKPSLNIHSDNDMNVQLSVTSCLTFDLSIFTSIST